MRPASLAEISRSQGTLEAIQGLLDALGAKHRGTRTQCPLACKDKGEDRALDAAIHDTSEHGYRVHCHACAQSEDYAGLYKLANGDWPTPSSAPAATPKPRAKPKPPDAARIWQAMPERDVEGEQYLATRGLSGAVGTGAVRFNTPQHADGTCRFMAANGYRIAMAMRGLSGVVETLQFRLARKQSDNEPKIISLKGASGKHAYFGSPENIAAAQTVCVTEGMADTLAAALWAGPQPGHAFVGCSGIGAVPVLAESIDQAGLNVTGKEFILFAQNDKEPNKSRIAFARLAKSLSALGAKCRFVAMPTAYKDVAEWRLADSSAPWPPPLVAKLEDKAQPAVSSPEPSVYGSNIATLRHLLGEPESAVEILGTSEIWVDEMTGRVSIGNESLSNALITKVRAELSQKTTTDGRPLKFGGDDVASVLELLAKRDSRHPVRAWIQSLRWDGKHRLSDPNELPGAMSVCAQSSRFVRKWLISAVARAIHPGCKVDTMLILHGKQGIYKSTFFAEMAGEWFCDEHLDLDNKDSKLVLSRSWMVEWSELSTMRSTRDMERVKAFLTQRVDSYRKPYGREVIEVPRSCVVVGTTNRGIFLTDTENRRFWPVTIHRHIDIEWVRKNREQLVAEAAHLLSTGEGWTLDSEDTQGLIVAQDSFLDEGEPWTEPIGQWLEKQEPGRRFSVLEILTGALDVDVEKVSRKEIGSVVECLKSLGWERERVRDGQARIFKWHKPAQGGALV